MDISSSSLNSYSPTIAPSDEQNNSGNDGIAIKQPQLANGETDSIYSVLSSTDPLKFQDKVISNSPDQPLLPQPKDPTILQLTTTNSPFFSPSFLIMLYGSIAELAKIQSKQRTIITEFDIAVKQWCLELAKRSSCEVEDHAQTQALIHYMSAGCAGAQAGVLAAKTAIGTRKLIDTYREYNKEKEKLKVQAQITEAKRPQTRITNEDIEAHNQADLAKEAYEHFCENKDKIIENIFNGKMLTLKKAEDITKQTTNSTDDILQKIMQIEDKRHEEAIKAFESYYNTAKSIPNSLSEMMNEIQNNIDNEFSFLSQVMSKNNQAFYIQRS